MCIPIFYTQGWAKSPKHPIIADGIKCLAPIGKWF